MLSSGPLPTKRSISARMSGAKRWLSVFFSLFGGVAGGLGEAGLAELLADLDELGGQSAEALVFGDLLAGAPEGVRRDGTGHGLAAGLEGERPVGAVAGVLGVSAATVGLAAAEEALVEGAGAEFADGGELGVELVEAELQGSGIKGGWHGASFLSVNNTERFPGATGLQHKGIREPTGQISESCRTPLENCCLDL